MAPHGLFTELTGKFYTLDGILFYAKYQLFNLKKGIIEVFQGILLVWLCLGLGNFAQAQGRQSTQLPVGLSLNSDYGLHDFVEGVNLDPWQLEEEKTPFLHLNSLRVANIVLLDEGLLRFELERPMAFTLVDVNGAGDHVERILKSFNVRTPPHVADKLMALYRGRYLALDRVDNSYIESLVQEFEEKGAEHMLSALVRGRPRPRIHTVDHVEVILNSDQLGSPEGTKVSHFTLRTWDLSELEPGPGLGTPAPNLSHRIDFEDITRFFKPEENELVQKYLLMLGELEKTRRKLKERGWLSGIYQSNLSRQDTTQALNDPDVIAFPLTVRCQTLFKP